MADLPLITAKSIAEAAYRGDQLAGEIYEISARYLGKGLALLVDILNPEMVILGGIYGKAQSLIEPYMRETLAQEGLSAAVDACRVAPSFLGDSIGDMAALVLADMASPDTLG